MIHSYLEAIQYNAGDLVPEHDAIAAVIIQDKKILMLDHVKYSFWTIPIGKIDPGLTKEQGLKQELKEEVNIVPTKYKEIGSFVYHDVRQGKKVVITTYIYLIIKWRGTVKNMEPQKHKSIKWMTLKEVKETKNLSDSTKHMLKYLRTL
jgi:ADP-ribose pyrophosphatase YjhB (NUDIX family)